MYEVSNLSIEDVREMIAGGDDSVDNQVRVSKNGYLYLSQDTGARNLNEVKFRFDTFDAGNDYVGLEASKDEEHIKKIYSAVIHFWNNDSTGYIDYWAVPRP